MIYTVLIIQSVVIMVLALFIMWLIRQIRSEMNRFIEYVVKNKLDLDDVTIKGEHTIDSEEDVEEPEEIGIPDLTYEEIKNLKQK